MSDFQQKPKRKRTFRNPYVFLATGIAIGVIAMAGIGAGFLFFMGSSSSFSEPIMITNPTVAAIPTAVPFSAQDIQPTVIANRIQAAAMSDNGRHLAVVSVEDAVSHIYLTELAVERNLTGNRYDLYQANGYFNDVVFSQMVLS